MTPAIADAVANIAQFVLPALLIAWADRKRPWPASKRDVAPKTGD